MNHTGGSKSKVHGVKLVLVGVGVAFGALSAFGLRHIDVRQLDPHPSLGI